MKGIQLHTMCHHTDSIIGPSEEYFIAFRQAQGSGFIGHLGINHCQLSTARPVKLDFLFLQGQLSIN